MSTPAQVSANRQNSLLSTGPASETGKAKSSLNAVKTGLTGRTVLLPGDDAALYEAHVSQFMRRHEPATEEERNLVQSLADTGWRLLRIPALEMGIYAVGRLEFGGLFPQEDEAVRKQLIEAQVFLSYHRQLNNLSIQEGRLRKQREKDLAELQNLQTRRQGRTNKEIHTAIKLYKEAQREGKPFDPAEFGFEITIQQLKQKMAFYEAQKAGSSLAISEIQSKQAA